MYRKIKNYLFISSVALSFLMFVFGCSPDAIHSSNNFEVVFEDNFDRGMDNWWTEGTDKVSVRNSRLYVDADGSEGQKEITSTVWCKTPITAENFIITYDAYVISSSTGVNNLNFFLNYSDPSGKDMYTTRQQRQSGAYGLYHDLNGYIFTYVRDIAGEADTQEGVPKGRFRIRRCPGFDLLEQSYDHDAEAGKKRTIEIMKIGGQLTYKVDGRIVCRTYDPSPWNSGYFGFRTFRTHYWVDNVIVKKLD